MADNINPDHYKNRPIETIDSISSILGRQGTIDYCIGNVVKYTSRWRQKNGIEDLKKAQWYLDRAIKEAAVPEIETTKTPEWLSVRKDLQKNAEMFVKQRTLSESPFQAPKTSKSQYYFGNPNADAA